MSESKDKLGLDGNQFDGFYVVDGNGDAIEINPDEFIPGLSQLLGKVGESIITDLRDVRATAERSARIVELEEYADKYLGETSEDDLDPLSGCPVCDGLGAYLLGLKHGVIACGYCNGMGEVDMHYLRSCRQRHEESLKSNQ